MLGNREEGLSQYEINTINRVASAVEKSNELLEPKIEPICSKRTGNIVAGICTIVLLGAAYWVFKDVKMVGMITNSIKYIK